MRDFGSKGDRVSLDNKRDELVETLARAAELAVTCGEAGIALVLQTIIASRGDGTTPSKKPVNDQ